MPIARNQAHNRSSIFDRANLIGAAALGVSVVSAGSVGFSLYMFLEHARYMEGFPPGVISGGTAYAINFYPYLIAIISLGLGFSGGCLLVGSCGMTMSDRRPLFSFLHVASAVSLLPFFYLLLLLIRGVLR
jgi:hypothetical protein